MTSSVGLQVAGAPAHSSSSSQIPNLAWHGLQLSGVQVGSRVLDSWPSTAASYLEPSAADPGRRGGRVGWATVLLGQLSQELAATQRKVETELWDTSKVGGEQTNSRDKSDHSRATEEQLGHCP